MTIQTGAELVAPRYNVRTLEITLAIAGCAGTLLGLIWQEPTIQLRAIAGAGVVLGAVVLAHIPFTTNWLLCQIARARCYTSLLKAKSETEDRLANIQAKYALAARSVPLPVLGFFSQEGQTVLIFARNGAFGVQLGERIYVVDDLQRKHRGTAVVLAVTPKTVEASLGDADALFEGYLRARISANPGMTCQVPESLVGLREKDIEAYYDALHEATEEEQYE